MRSSKKSDSNRPTVLKVLVTSGPTSVPIDNMRIITNRSTGELGRLVSNAFAAKGARVTLLEGAVTTTVPLNKKVAVQKFYFYDELERRLRTELRKGYNVVIHAAAVSDFKLAKTFHGKVASGRSLTLQLKPTKKLVNDIKRLSPYARLAAFKLEQSLKTAQQKVSGLFKEAKADWVVANCCVAGRYQAAILRRDGSSSAHVKGKKELVKALVKEIDGML